MSASGISGYVGMGRVRKPSGERTWTACPQRSSHFTLLARVTTTPLTCGDQASVTRRIRKALAFRRQGAALQRFDGLPVDDPQLPALQLDECSEALDPVAVVAVEDAADVAVFGVPDERYGGEIMAWVQLRAGESATAEEPRGYCKGRIAHYKVPRHVWFVEEVPMTVTGKLQKFRMREIATPKIAAAGGSKG